jgi:hypothetical protein
VFLAVLTSSIWHSPDSTATRGCPGWDCLFKPKGVLMATAKRMPASHKKIWPETPQSYGLVLQERHMSITRL